MVTVALSYEAEGALPARWEEIIREMAAAAADCEGCPYACHIELLLTDDAGIREINRLSRGIDAPTDVLSFPGIPFSCPSAFSEVDEGCAGNFDPETGELLLGDIVLNKDRVLSQASEYGHGTERELAFLLVHSMLHLFGYDHEEDAERLAMEKRQEEILAGHGYTR